MNGIVHPALFFSSRDKAKVAGTLRRAVHWSELTMIPGERHMECTCYFDFYRLCLGEQILKSPHHPSLDLIG